VHLASLQAEQVPLPDSPHSKFDMMLTAHLTDALSFQLLYRRDLFSEPRMHAVVEQFKALVGQALAAPEARIEQYSLVTSGAGSVRDGGNHSRGATRLEACGSHGGAALQPCNPPPGATRHAGIPARVRSHATVNRESVALVDGHGAVSYGELDGYSDLVAGTLAAQGVRPGVVVPVRHGSALALVGGVLGAMKVGASCAVERLPESGAWTAEALSLAPGSRVGVLPGASPNVLLQAAFTALASGATAYFPPPPETAARDLWTWLDQRIAVAFGEPAAWRRLKKTGSRLTSLRCAVFAGGVLVREDVLRVRALSPEVECLYFCGFEGLPQPSSCYRVPADAREIRTIVPLGRGLDGVELAVLSRAGQLAGTGELGEIFVRDGQQRASSTAASGQCVSTGLLGRFLPDGTVDRIGGASDWGSVDGYTIRFDEVASALMQHPDVLDARVAIDTNASGPELVAEVVSDDEGPWPGEALDGFVRDFVPDYMVPRRIVCSVFPLAARP
jgi:non-ribosomal peptide synthetase component F